MKKMKAYHNLKCDISLLADVLRKFSNGNFWHNPRYGLCQSPYLSATYDCTSFKLRCNAQYDKS